MARRPKKLVRQFKTQVAPAGARGYRPQAVAQAIAHPAVADPTVPRPAAHYGSLETPVARPIVDAYVPPPVTAQIPRTMGTPALPPDWYPETPHRIWSPQPQPTTDPRLRRNTGEEDLTTITTANTPIGGGFFPEGPPEVVEDIGRPNVGVDITPEQFTLPPQQQIHERPSVIDYGPITTPIARPTEDLGYMWDASDIEPTEPLNLTPGPQITATEQSLYEPQPIEDAYAYPIQADYPQPQPHIIDTTTPLELPKPEAHYGELNPEGFVPPDDVTNLIDTILPETETLEAKTLDIPQEGPQWVEDPYTLATQELIDQAPFDQTDPSIYQPQPIIDQAPEIAYTQPQPQQQDPYAIDYGPTYGDPITQEVESTGEIVNMPVQQPPITQPPGLGMPEIPTAVTTIGGPDERVYLHQEGDMVRDPENLESGPSHYVRDTQNQALWDPEGMPHGESSSGVFEYTTDPLGDAELQPGIVRKRLVGDTGEGTPVGTGPVITEGGLIVGERPESVIPAKTITPSGEVVGDDGEIYTVDTTAGVDIEQLPEAIIEGAVAEGPLVDSTEATGPVADPEPFTPEIAGPPAPTGDQDTTTPVDPPVTTTPGQGGRKWLHTGPQDFAETRWQLFGAAQGDPIITDTPAVSGPVVNRETGEITTEPLTWWQNRPAGSSVSPYGATTVGGTSGTGTEGTTKYVGGKAEPSPAPRNLQQNDWTSGVSSTANVQNFLDEASRAGVPVVRVDSFGNPDIDFSSSTWSTASDAGVDTQSLGKINFKDADGTTKNAFEVGVNFVSKGVKGLTNLVFGNSTDQSAKDLASNLGEKETIRLSDRVRALWKEYALAWETDDVDPNNMRNPLTGEVQTKGDLQTVFMYNLLSGNVPAALGQLSASLGNKIFTDFSKGLKNIFGSDVIQSVTSGVMDTIKFMGNKAGKFLGLDLFNKKVESKDFETQEMQDWEQTYGEATKGKKESEGEVEGTDPEWMKIWGKIQIDPLNPYGKDDSVLPHDQSEFSIEGFNKRLQAGEITDLGEGKNRVFAVFTDRLGQSVSTSKLNVGSIPWSEADIVDLAKGGDGNLWAVVKEGGVEVSRPVTHGFGANEEPVEANIFGDNLGLRTIGGGSQVNRGSLRNMRPSGKVGVTAGGGGGLLKTVWEWITSKGK